jgi:hypothetical protein
MSVRVGLARTNRPQTGHTCLVRAEMRSTLSIDNINTQYIYIYKYDGPSDRTKVTNLPHAPRARPCSPRSHAPARPALRRPSDRTKVTNLPHAPRAQPCSPRTHAPARPALRPLCPAPTATPCPAHARPGAPCAQAAVPRAPHRAAIGELCADRGGAAVECPCQCTRYWLRCSPAPTLCSCLSFLLARNAVGSSRT